MDTEIVTERVENKEIVPSVSIDNFLGQRDAIISRTLKIVVLLREMHEVAKSMPGESYFKLGLKPSFQIKGCYGDIDDDGCLDKYIKAADAACWERLFNLSGMATFMDKEAREAWRKNIDELAVPALTRENIEATFRALRAGRVEMFERGIVNVFRGLSWDYKTNNPVKFGKRIVLRYIMRGHGVCDLPNFEGCHKLDDLARVLHILDGKPEPDCRNNSYRKLSDARRAGEPADFAYFSIRTFKNGNGHLTFKRLDLVDQMNLIVARHHPGALAPSREA